MNRILKSTLTAVCISAFSPVISNAVVIFSDDFSSGEAFTSGSGTQLINANWYSSGPESKAYNSTNNAGTDFSGKLGWEDTGAGFFDSAATSFDSVTLNSIGDYITLSFDYTISSAANNNTGLRVRLYGQGSDVFVGGSGYGVNIPSGTATGSLSYRSYVSGNPYSTGTSEANAINSGSTYGGGEVIFTVTKTAADEYTLSGSYDATAFITRVAGNDIATFDALGFSVGSLAHGLSVDNVQVTSNIPEPATLGMISMFGGGILFIRRRFMM